MISRGSEWRRWDPHIHAPGTVLNNQFRGADPWDTYLTTLEDLTPTIEAIGVTDYYVTDTYEEVLRRKAAGRLPDVKLIFSNIEMRLDVAARSGFVNIHLLVSPEEPDHLDEVGRFLTRLQFNAHGDRFDCTRADLIRLGKRADPSIRDDRAALAHGATQFKVNFAQLREVFKESDWARANIRVAVAGGAQDGTSGVRQPADATLRQEIERFAHVIFSSSPSQRDFWLGLRGVSPQKLRERYDGCKPCLHGSDAHDQPTLGQPSGERFSWIKGAPTFDALRQACIVPAGRAYVGAEPPRAAMPSQVISQIDIVDAPWASTPSIPLNPGLVAIIGARGSGKTALADMIAAGCDAIPPDAWTADGNASPSFLVRARPLVADGSVRLSWGGGAETTRRLDGRDGNDPLSYPRARYLSQQFVEELCSSTGASESLIREIERVIFEAHPPEAREFAVDFDELREHRTLRFQQARKREVEALGAVSERIANELEKEGLVGTLTAQAAQKESSIRGYNADLAKLVVKGGEIKAQRHAALSAAAQGLSSKIQAFAAQRRTFVAMQDEVTNVRATRAPEMLREAQARHAGSGLSREQWDEFLLIYKGDVDKALAAYVRWADGEMGKLNGVAPPEGDPAVPLIADGVDLATLQLATIRAEMARIEKLISADTQVRKQYTALSARIAQENAALLTLKTRLEDAQGAAARRRALQTEREDAYGRLFEAILNEEQALTDLYAPLMARLAASSDTLRKLTFSVTRIVDATAWADEAEEALIDCRKSGPFHGRGSLANVANSELKTAWETGTASDVQASMAKFIATYTRALLAHAPYAPTQQAEFRAWSKRFARWLFSTEHITVRYEIAYDGVDIRNLSPGTRGIVLLLLYLALDDADDRPLIIDQPEENLDPKSVFDELVSLFLAAKAKRQVIMVTHNANLVVNTDADQVIIATAEPDPSGGLPAITYVAGGLEEGDIRDTVCEILEGGADAFRERARRLRVTLER
jgi:energy-coupling factor transporter ATP-binding protein EcfA2